MRQTKFISFGLVMFTILCAAPRLMAAPLDDLIAGARKEGTLEFYAPSTLTPQGAQAIGAGFNKKFGLNVKLQYSPSGNMTRDIGKVVGFGASGVPPEWDLMVVTDAHHATLWVKKMHQPFDYKSIGVDPKAVQFDNGAVSFANQFVLPAYNKQLVSEKEAPKSWDDLLNPKWKGKMSIVSTTTGTRWIGSTLDSFGREYLEKIAEQDVKVQNMAGAALAQMVVSGEVPLSPTIFDANITQAKQKGAPVEWRPLEPVVTTVSYAGLTLKAPHPHAAMLYLDWLHSKEGQQMIMKGGLWSAREDIGSLGQKFKKSYIDEKYSVEEAEKKYAEWDALMQKLFIRRK